MEWIRDNRRAAALLGAGVVLALVALLFFVLKQRDPRSDTVIGGQAPSLVDPGSGLAGKDGKKKLSKKKAGQSGLSDADAGPLAGDFPGFGSTDGLSGLGNLKGLPGGTLTQSLPTVSIDITVTSSVPIGTVGYVIPTSKKSPVGRVDGVGTRWHLGTTGYGRPDYARVFFAAGPSGAPVTCTIRVNGKVTEHRSTEGPYGQMMCQG